MRNLLNLNFSIPTNILVRAIVMYDFDFEKKKFKLTAKAFQCDEEEQVTGMTF